MSQLECQDLCISHWRELKEKDFKEIGEYVEVEGKLNSFASEWK